MNNRGLPPSFYLLTFALCLTFATGCRMDMQDQPRYEVYESSSFFKDGLSSRPLVEGTVPRGYLKADKEFYTGKIDRAQRGTAGGATPTNQNTGEQMTGTEAAQPGAQANEAARNEGATNQTGGRAAVAEGDPNDVETFPFPITEEIVNRGQERYKIFCAMCHGETGYGDGIIIRRGFSNKRPSYHTNELRNARVGHFFDVITNGWGAMPSYSAQIPVRDRWAIIAYVRALQKSQAGATTTNATAPNESTNAPSTGGPK